MCVGNNCVCVYLGNPTTQNVKLTTYASASNYGGPKGLLIYVSGTLTNNGEISMTARGARVPGDNVYIWKNSKNCHSMHFEYTHLKNNMEFCYESLR